MNKYYLILTFVMGIVFHSLLVPTSMGRVWEPTLVDCDLDQSPSEYKPSRVIPRCATTFVTQYFHIPSKHGYGEYAQWIQSMPPVCLVVFTDTPFLWKISDDTIVIETSLCREASFLNRSSCFWREQWYQDPEAIIHRGFLLYLTWNLKARFLSRAVEWNLYDSDFFFWMDAGYARVPLHGDGRRLLPSIDPTRMHFLLVNPFTRVELEGSFHYTVGRDRLAGNLFGGHHMAVRVWTRLYYQIFQEYVGRGWFVGKDQNLMNSLCVQHPSLCLAVDPGLGSLVNPWFSLWGWLLGQRSCNVLQMNETVLPSAWFPGIGLWTVY